MAEDLDWLIVGGGLHGVHMAVRLLAQAGVSPERLRLLDPAPRLLDSWRRCSANTGMRHLRSPAVHHLDVDPFSLLKFAGANTRGRGAAKKLFTPPYDRPSVELFAHHCDDVIARHGLTDLHIRDRATDMELSCGEALVHLESGAALRTRWVVLAMGAGGQLRRPDWARALQAQGLPIRHVFEPGFKLDPDTWPERVAVVGGGITAAQVALRLARAGREVHFIARHALRKHQFDSDPGWAGPKYMTGFSATQSLAKRREMIRKARHAGSLPPDVHRALRRAISKGHVQFHHGEPHPTVRDPHVIFQVGPDRIEVDGVLLATGFDGARPGGTLIDTLIQTHTLPCAECGYPVVDRYLRWHPAVFVTGPLAELEVGPVSRNILGARRAAERIVPFAQAS